MKRFATALGTGLLRLLVALRARALTCWGRWRLFRGDAAGASKTLESAADVCPGAFGPLVHLARACLRQNDLFRARRALARAREASPDRFAREAETWVRLEGYDVAALTDVPAAPGRGGNGPASRPASRPVEAPAEPRTAVLRERSHAPAGLPFGDCRDLDEYSRFRAMPAISKAEIDAMDWDGLAEDLQDG
jgi:hypothetical protein